MRGLRGNQSRPFFPAAAVAVGAAPPEPIELWDDRARGAAFDISPAYRVQCRLGRGRPQER